MRFLATAVAAGLLAFAAPASAQTYPAYPSAPQPAYPYYSMMDDDSTTDFPTHSPTDFVADQLNRQVLEFNAQPPVYPAPVYPAPAYAAPVYAPPMYLR